MKFKITLIDPDGVYESLEQAAELSMRDISGLCDTERRMLIETRREKLEEQCKQWIEHGEYVTIEIDTEENTAIVCKA